MNGPNWLERTRGLLSKGRPATSGQAPEGRSRRRGGVVFTVLLVAFLLVAVAATGIYGANRMGHTGGAIPAANGEDLYLVREDVGNGTVKEPSGAQDTEQTAQNWDRMIIRTATLQLQVKDVAASMDQVRNVVGGHAGYITGSESRQEGDYTVGSMTVQVPAAQFDAAMTQLRTLGVKVLNENVTSSDVTEEYTDLNSQLRNLQATETRILDLMKRAEQIDDVLTLDRELRGIQGEIERIQGRVNFLSKRTEMSTITVSLYPEAITVEPSAQPAEAWDPVKIASQAWEASLRLLANVGTLAITVVVYLWWLLPLALIATIFLRRTRRAMPQTPATTAAE